MSRTEIWSHGNSYLHLPNFDPMDKEMICDPNTMDSFETAAILGVDGIEADVSFSKDKKAIIYHPGSIYPSPLSLSLEKINDYYPDIPSLDELLDFLSEYPRLKCLLDMKNDSNELVGTIVKKLQATGLRDRVFLTASRRRISLMGLYSNGEMLIYAKSLDPQIKTHIIDLFPFNMARTGRKFGADIISFGWFNNSALSKLMFNTIFEIGWKNIKEEILRARQEGMLVFGGITDTADDVKYFIDAGVDGIVCNNPYEAQLTRVR